MRSERLGQAEKKLLEQVLGYLNFSSGAEDPQFLANLNRLFFFIDHSGKTDQPLWKAVHQQLVTELELLKSESPVFSDAGQSEAVIDLAFNHFLPFYMQFHSDLLFHQRPEYLFGPFFVGRVFEKILQQGQPWSDTQRIVATARTKLDDFIGYRPVATLESQKIEPYAHEWIRPVPIYIRDVGAVRGPHYELVELALELLRQADTAVLEPAHFNPSLLDELAIDPRAYDFDHPVNRRPNYHFGLWDPLHIDNQGRYRRFVVQQVTLDALVSRCEQNKDFPVDQMLYEAAAVLAGTILMGSGMSGSGPSTFDSTVTLGALMPIIARYRDTFYENLLKNLTGPHGERLREEAVQRRQPFGAARQHLNAQLASLRAAQMQHVQLANIYARMGFPEAAKRQANIIPVVSARMVSRIDCRLTTGRQAIKRGELDVALVLLEEIMDLLHRAIACGAVIDPWNIMGFDANFSLFPAMENSIRDHRADELIDLVEEIFSYCSLLWSEAAAVDDQISSDKLASKMSEIVNWWNQYAVHEVSSVDAADGREVYQAAQNVAGALRLWHQGGAESDNVRFWASHSSLFQSPRAYSMVIDTLLDRGDDVASMALLIHWLSQTDVVRLEAAGISFADIARRWMYHLIAKSESDCGGRMISVETWNRMVKFLDYLEANAESFWDVPDFQLRGTGDLGSHSAATAELDSAEEDDDESNPFKAAYENVVYRDSTDDGMEGQIYESESINDSEMDAELKRLEERFLFLNCNSRLWQIAAAVATPICFGPNENDQQRAEFTKRQPATLKRWWEIARERQSDLEKLLKRVQDHRLPRLANDYEAMTNYDRHRWFKEHLMDRVIECYVENDHALRVLSAARLAIGDDPQIAAEAEQVLETDQAKLIHLLAAILKKDIASLRKMWNSYLDLLQDFYMSYVPLSRGGDAKQIARARVRQDAISHLLTLLPRLGLMFEVSELIDAVREMERRNPAGSGALTEFDELYQKGFEAMVQSLIRFSQAESCGSSCPPAPSATTRLPRSKPAAKESDKPPLKKEKDDRHQSESQSETLFRRLEHLTEPMLVLWLEHSRTLRLSVLEKVTEKKAWEDLVDFIKKYGADLFTQSFFNLSNVRAILHQGVSEWFAIVEDSDEADSIKLFRDLDGKIDRRYAAQQITLILEAIIENYGEYRDYNSTTTQSDQGDMLYMLLEFLRLRMRYDRIAWHLNPVKWAHRVLVENHQDETARFWRRSLNERVGTEAKKYLRQLAKLQKNCSMQMPSIADRLEERFIKPLQIDRLRALIPLAMNDVDSVKAQNAFEILEQEIDIMARNPVGAGLEVPQWILALQQEVDLVMSSAREELNETELWVKSEVFLSVQQIESELDRIADRFNPSV